MDEGLDPLTPSATTYHIIWENGATFNRLAGKMLTTLGYSAAALFCVVALLS